MTVLSCPPAVALPRRLVFLTQAVSAPAVTGAIAPSGRVLTRALVAPVAERAGADLRVLEVGAGSGPVTRALLGLLTPGSQLDVVEADEAFIPGLTDLARAASTPTTVQHARIQDAVLDPGYDVIVSALPFANFALADVQAIFDRYLQHTGPGGVITWFGYRASRAARALTAGPAEAARHRAVHAHLAGYGGSSTTVWANLPPARATRLRPHG